MTVKVSVVVPVYNPGEHIDALIESVLGQSLADDEYEVIFADDACTDGTAERLDALVAEHDCLRVIHNAPNSGWPGKPRNLGIDAARGEYVYFVDSDDWLEPEALERLYDYAVANDSDIVWGRVVGENRYAPREIFRRNNPDAQLGREPLLSLLTVHKMFRTSFLRSAGIRFPEGRRRLEDHVFVMSAYFAAKKISVLADYTCYHWRRIEGDVSISRGTGDPQEYFERVREVIDIVDANTEPGDFRDRLLAHWWGGKSLYWFENNVMTQSEPDYVRSLFDSVRTLALERFPPALDRYLPVRRRVMAGLVRADEFDRLSVLMNWLTGVRAVSVADPVIWDAAELKVRFSATMQDADGRPLMVRRVGDRDLWRLPPELGIPDPPPDAVDITPSVYPAFLDGYLRDRTTSVTELLPAEQLTGLQFDADGCAAMQASAEITIDPTRHMVLLRPSSIYDTLVRLHCAGWDLDSRPALPDEDVRAGIKHTFGTQIVSAYGTEGYGNLSLRRSKVPAPKPPPPPPPPPPSLLRRVVRKARRIVRRVRAGSASVASPSTPAAPNTSRPTSQK